MADEAAIRALVRTAVEDYARAFSGRHISERDDPEGTLNMKIHNTFVAALGTEVLYYSALVRSLDSSLGNMLEGMAIEIARLTFEVSRSVEGSIFAGQTSAIATLLEEYKRRSRRPAAEDYQGLRHVDAVGESHVRHDSDYLLRNRETGEYSLIQLKIGGDLDNKKARSEKEALLEQFCILANTVAPETHIKLYFATAYNRYGEGRPWRQERVRQFFAVDELLVSSSFWNFICDRADGNDIVISEYRDAASELGDALEAIKRVYLPAAAVTSH